MEILLIYDEFVTSDVVASSLALCHTQGLLVTSSLLLFCGTWNLIFTEREENLQFISHDLILLLLLEVLLVTAFSKIDNQYFHFLQILHIVDALKQVLNYDPLVK
jgi:hypothetical protein